MKFEEFEVGKFVRNIHARNIYKVVVKNGWGVCLEMVDGGTETGRLQTLGHGYDFRGFYRVKWTKEKP